jgi:hypothetical protein
MFDTHAGLGIEPREHVGFAWSVYCTQVGGGTQRLS